MLDFEGGEWIPSEVLAGIVRPDAVLTMISSAGGNIVDFGYSPCVIYCYRLVGCDVSDALRNTLKRDSRHVIVESIGEVLSIIKNLTNSERDYAEEESLNADVEYLLTEFK